MSLTRQQKRSELRAAVKSIEKARRGTLTKSENKQFKERVKRLQAEGLIGKPKLSKFQTVKEFMKGLLGGQVGYRIRSN